MEATTRSKRPEDIEATERINRVCGPLWAWLGFTRQFDVKLKFLEELKEEENSEGFSAETERRFPYRTVYITWSRKKLKEMDDTGLRFVGLHEAMHELLTGDFQRELTTLVENIAITADDAAIVEGKTAELVEDLVDRLSYFMLQAFEEEGIP